MLRKSEEKTVGFRVKGNKAYKTRKFFEALQNYNKALCYAPTGTEAEANIYANRSAVYLESKLYEKCLINIQKALDHNHPNPKSLEARRERCLEMMKTEEDVRFERRKFELVSPPHPKYPLMADCLEYRKDKKGNPHVFATRDLHVGDHIAWIQPICPIISPDNVPLRCSYCLKDNLMDLYPCPNCSHAMYCSDECKDEAFKRYHNFECGLTENQLNSVPEMPLRVFLDGLNAFDGDIEAFEAFMKENEGKKHYLLDFEITDVNSKENVKAQILALYSFATRDPSKLNSSLIKENIPKFFKRDENSNRLWKEHEKFITTFVTKMEHVLRQRHNIAGWPLKLGGLEKKQLKRTCEATNCVIGRSVYPIDKCFQHSCAPNARKMSIDSFKLMTVYRPIKAGEEIFNCFTGAFDDYNKMQRQIELIIFHNIECKCEACENNYPTMLEMEVTQRPGNLNQYALMEYDNANVLGEMNYEQLWQKFDEYRKIIEGNQARYPSMDTLTVTICLISVLSYMNMPEFLFKD